MLEILQILLYYKCECIVEVKEVNSKQVYTKQGYLNDSFRLFHLRDSIGQELDYHYHEFDKIVIFLSGCVTYHVEGISYPLKPWDVLLISHHLIHKADISRECLYERIVIYIDPTFVETNSTPNAGLMSCFRVAEQNQFYLVRSSAEEQERISRLLTELENAITDTEFASDILSRTLFLQILIYINRVMLQRPDEFKHYICEYDPKIAGVLSYINENLSKNLTVELLAAKGYMSKYHFMRRFKELTGYTVHNYIQQKRLIMGARLIRSGMPVTRAALQCGFSDYSTFQRAFKKLFGVTPQRFT